MMSGDYVPGSWHIYAPNKGAAIFFTVAFTLTGAWHVYLCIHHHSWKLTGLHPTATVLFIAGFLTRCLSAWDYTNLIKFIVSTVLIYAAPPLVELCNYHVLGRILAYAPQFTPIHPGRVLTTFGFLSSVIEALNGTGVAYSANMSLPEDKRAVGRDLVKASLVMQLFVLAALVVLAGVFQRRVWKAGGTWRGNKRLNTPLWVLYISTALILARTIFRVEEYWALSGAGSEEIFMVIFNPTKWGTVEADEAARRLPRELRAEWYFMVFEASVMLVNQVMWAAWHPRRYLPKSSKVCLADDGETEVEGKGYEDERKFWVTVVDPFDIWGMVKRVRGQGREEKEGKEKREEKREEVDNRV